MLSLQSVVWKYNLYNLINQTILIGMIFILSLPHCGQLAIAE